MEISNCHYCGGKPTLPQQSLVVARSIGWFCSTCNKMKLALGKEEFLTKIEQIYTHQITQDEDKRSVFVGRFQPFHISHEALIRTRLDEGHPCLVLVRATHIDDGNPYTLHETLQMIRAAFIGENVKVLPISNISGIYYGRKVGYLVEEIDMPDSVKRISATKIRE